MSEKQTTLGQAIDQTIAALVNLDPNSQRTALQAVCSHLGISLVPPSRDQQAPGSLQGSEGPLRHEHHVRPQPVDIRTLKEEKKPSSARQMACVVAYYLTELASADERKDSVSTQDLEKYFKQAGFKLPQKMEQVLPDAKRSGYFETAGRGEYKLNAVGYNLVAHNLPAKSEQ